NMWLRFAHSPWKVLMLPEELFRYTSAPGSLYSQSERCLTGELLNDDKLGEQLNLPQERRDWKKRQILQACGRDFLQMRNMQPARQCLGQAFRTRPSLSGLYCWVATFVPEPVLDLRRQMLSFLRG